MTDRGFTSLSKLPLSVVALLIGLLGVVHANSNILNTNDQRDITFIQRGPQHESPLHSLSSQLLDMNQPISNPIQSIVPDAPKYYDLNSKLYNMAPVSNLGPNAEAQVEGPANRPQLRPRDGIQFKTSDGMVDELSKRRPASGIDSLIKNINRPEMDGPNVLGSNADPGSDLNEATIQRKSSSVDESARRKRASVRQVPPKLKPRRVSRNLRRRKLRHNPKPKRRA